MASRLLLTVTLLAGFLPVGHSQQYDRRARDEPEVVVNAGGRVGTADAITFSPQGEYVFAVGDDKVVRVWAHSAAGLDSSSHPNDVLHWRSWRDQLGGIKAIDISPDGKRVVIGGYGLRISTVAVLDCQTGETVALTWPKAREGDHFDAVMAVDFHPDGKKVGFGTADGTLWIWDPKKLSKPERDRIWNAPMRVGRFAPLPGTDFNFPRNVRFSDESTLVGVAQSGEVLACRIDGQLTDDPNTPTPAGKTLFDTSAGLPLRHALDKARWTGDGKWLAVTTSTSLVLLRSANGKDMVKLDLGKDHFARSIAVHPRTGKIAIGVASIHPPSPGRPRFYMERDDEIWVYDSPANAATAQPRRIPHSGRAESLAFHPIDDRLAIAGGDADEVTLLDLDKPDKSLSVVRGVGRRIHAINLSETGDNIAIQTARNPAATNPNARGRGPWLRFNLPRFSTTNDSSGKWIGPINTLDGWEIEPSQESRFVWFARRTKASGQEDKLQLLLDPDIDQSPTCFTFLPTAAGKATRVLVGHYYGCSLFVLDLRRAAKDKQSGALLLPKSKLYIGHGAEVNAIAADSSGTWFVTAGADQTVAAWSLADWDAEPALGGAFAVKDADLVVHAVNVGSPTWEAGLSEGDRIDRLAIGGEVVYDAREGKQRVGTADGAAKALAHPRSGVEHFFWWQSPGQTERRATPCRLKQRPLWKWFPAFDDRDRLADSVMWMWHGSYYFTNSAHGDRMVGWHLNDSAVAGTPTFQSLERYKHIFLRPDVIAKLLTTRSVADALKLAYGDNPRRRSFREVEPEPVNLAVKQAVVPKGGLAVALEVNPIGTNPDFLIRRVELWLNDYRFRTWETKGKERFQTKVVIPESAFRGGDNQITLLAINPLRGRAEATRLIHSSAKLNAPGLLGMMGGIDDYSAHRKALGGARGGFDDLTKARADVASLREGLLHYRGKGKYFPAGDVAILLNDDATREGLTAALARLKTTPVKPDDLLVVFLAGHGDLIDAKGRPLPPPSVGIASRGLPAETGQFVFCGPNYSTSRPRQTALAAEELFDALAEVNCRKLVLLDACHAGAAIGTNLLRQLIPNGQGPVVIAACGQSQISFEDESLGHGAFTYAVLEALGSKFRLADRNSDGALSARELYDYLADRVPALVEDLHPGKAQNPICFPQSAGLPKFALVKR